MLLATLVDDANLEYVRLLVAYLRLQPLQIHPHPYILRLRSLTDWSYND
jgi:hypothetical protein